ncbi:MAG: hypothetical protein GXP62_15815 [Oligoflexia bacterium]|nr:hypothetical protein [Oligoflexia bacterium]
MRLGTRAVALLALTLVSPVALAKKGKKKKKKGDEPVVLVGWQTQEGWAGSCYYPPVWSTLNTTEKLLARQEALDALVNQWGGGRDDGVSFDQDMVTDTETVLLGRPAKTEDVADQNRDHCIAVMSRQSSASDWESWVKSLAASLTVGECKKPLDYTMFDYLDIGTGWQRPLSICQGERVRVSGTATDKYRITEDGPWITVEGDPDQPAMGTDLPCNIEGCLKGQLILRFVAESGWEKVYVVGSSMVFEAPEHGVISYRINDDSWVDNAWFKSHGIEDHTAIEVSPAK